ncbi:MAG: DUF438 domain-containing protein [Candidatus Hodarchaeota archaeon]
MNGTETAKTLSKSTRVIPLIDKFPFLMETLIELNPKLKRLKNPIMRRTIGKRATLVDVSDISGTEISQLLELISRSIQKNSGIEVSIDESLSGKSGWESARERKISMLKSLILELHEGGDMKELRNRFKEEFGDVDASEIAAMEQSIIDEGELTTKQITKLCDLHVGIFEHSLEQHEKPESVHGHPIHTYMEENKYAKELIKQIKGESTPELLMQLAQIEIHYTRLENQLFPRLEKAGFTGPSQVMWAKHDEVRELLKRRDTADIRKLTTAIEDLIFKEETILFPTSLEILSKSDWIAVRAGEEEIGYAWVTPGDDWKPVTPQMIHDEPQTIQVTKGLKMKTGNLTLDQINLILTNLPVEISFVNENDEVIYYSDHKERIFPRSPGVIGRKVQNCHPPKSVDIVNKILEAFKKGIKDKAAFWIPLNGKFLFIQYFAIRDRDGYYKGTLEVTQDITEIQKLEGTRRLLNWNDEKS